VHDAVEVQVIQTAHQLAEIVARHVLAQGLLVLHVVVHRRSAVNVLHHQKQPRFVRVVEHFVQPHEVDVHELFHQGHFACHLA